MHRFVQWNEPGFHMNLFFGSKSIGMNFVIKHIRLSSLPLNFFRDECQPPRVDATIMLDPIDEPILQHVWFFDLWYT